MASARLRHADSTRQTEEREAVLCYPRLPGKRVVVQVGYAKPDEFIDLVLLRCGGTRDRCCRQ